jgi:hypothetical protein
MVMPKVIIELYDRTPEGKIECVYVTGFKLNKDAEIEFKVGSRESAVAVSQSKQISMIKLIAAAVFDFTIDHEAATYIGMRLVEL